MELPATPPESPRRPRYEQGYQNLRRYLREARLPNMKLAADAPPIPTTRVPPDDFLLSPEVDSRRKLRKVLRLSARVLQREVMEWIDTHIPDMPTLMPGAYSGHGLNMRLPAPSFSIPYEEPAEIADMHGLSDWLDLPLLTAERAVRMVWPDKVKDFHFSAQTNEMEDEYPQEDEDANIYRTYCLRQDDDVAPDDIYNSSYKIVVAAVAPWSLSASDMDDFFNADEIPTVAPKLNPRSMSPPPPLSRSHKLWAKLWDDCSSKRCRYFVVSVYHRWVFGVFTRGWTTALVTPPISYTARACGPSVIQCLVFWIAAAMEIPGTWTLPELDSHAHPDISDVHNVAKKLSAPEDMDCTRQEWFEKCFTTEFEEDGSL